MYYDFLLCLCFDFSSEYDFSIGFSSFTNNDITTPKSQHALASAFFNKIAKDMEVHFNLKVRKKQFLSISKHHMLHISYDSLIDGLG